VGSSKTWISSKDRSLKFSVIHPTARVTSEFEHAWWKAAGVAGFTCDDRSQVEYILVVHHSRRNDLLESLRESMNKWSLEWGRLIVVTNFGRDCLVDQCNAGMLAASGEIQIWNQDDMRYPEHWDTEVLKLIPDTSALVCLQAGNDGRRPDLLTLPTIMTKALRLRMGPISPDYESMQSDVEESIKCRELGAVIAAPHIYFQHFHFASRSAEKSDWDPVYALENREEAYRVGMEVFLRRQAMGFPFVKLPGFPEGARRELPTRAISICIPGESHRAEWEVPFWGVLNGLADQGWDIRIHPDYCTYVHHTRELIATAVIEASRDREAEYVVWIDDDNTPSSSMIRSMIGYLDANPEVDGVVGWYWFYSKGIVNGKQSEGWMICCGDFKPGTFTLSPITAESLFSGGHRPIEWAGFGCVVMRYAVQKALGPRTWRPINDDNNEFGSTGDDVSFFARAKDAGYRFVVDPGAHVEHWKTRPVGPDFRVHPSAPESGKQAVEADRKRRKGAMLDIGEDAHRNMEAAKAM
jgi:hypothetical protein